MLEKALAETDPATTNLVVMMGRVTPPFGGASEAADLTTYDRELLTAVVDKAEHAGKEVQPLIVPTNNPLHAVLKTAMDVRARELIVGASHRVTVNEQLELIASYWIRLHGGAPAPLTVRILSPERDVRLDLGGGGRIPKIGEHLARSAAELRAVGQGVNRVLLLYDGSPAHGDLLQAVLTLLDSQVKLGLLRVPGPDGKPPTGDGLMRREEDKARQLGRPLTVVKADDAGGPAVVERLRSDAYDLVILPMGEAPGAAPRSIDERTLYILTHAPCRVFLAAAPAVV